MWRSEMNATSIVTRSGAYGTSSFDSAARVHAFADEDARIGAKPPIELAVADVERDDRRGAALQQHVGEAAGRRADVERAPAGGVDAEGVERAGELDAAAADVGMIRRDELDARVGGDRGAGLRDDLAVDRHLAGENQRPRALARGREAAIDEGDVETDFVLATALAACRARPPPQSSRCSRGVIAQARL